MEVISKKQAKQQGLKLYFTGVPCKHGHISERNVAKSDCLACLKMRGYKWAKDNKEHKNALSRELYKITKPRVKASNKKWREANLEKSNATIKAYQEANKVHLYERQQIWRANNSEKVAISTKKSKEKNKESILASGKKWRSKNKYKINEFKQRRQAQKLNATPSWADFDKIRWFYAEAKRLSNETGIKHHVDHIVPLKSKLVCGLHVHTNLQVLPALENQKKSNRSWPGM